MDMRLASLEHRPGLAITGEDLVFLTGQPTPYGMLEHLSAEWVLALRELGRRAWLLRTGVPGGMEALQALLAAGRPKAFLAFSGVNWDLLANERSLYDVLDIPYVGLMFDDPAYFPQRHRLGSRNLTLLFTDDDHHDASRALSPANAPRGRFRFGVRPPVDVPIEHDARTIPILFAKTPGDPDRERRSWNDLAPPLRAIINDVADAALWQDERGLWPIVRERLALDGITAGLDGSIGMATIVARVDHYVRLARAVRLVRALAPHDALIVGAGWQAHLPANARARVVPQCQMAELFAMMSTSRIVVNVQPNNRFAPHERFLSGMQRGCCVLTDAAAPIRAAVGESHFAPVRWHDALDDVVADLVADPARVRAIGERAAPMASDAWSATRGAATVLRAVDTLTAMLATTSPITLPAALSA